MKRIPLLLLLAVLAALPALAVEVPAGAAATTPTVTLPAVAPATATAGSTVAPLFPNLSPEIHFVVLCPQCPIYPDIGCSCDWILCNGAYICGRPR